MRVSNVLIGIALLVTALGCDTSDNVDATFKNYFIKTFGGDGDQEGVDIIVNADETITMLGNTIKPSGERKIYFLKTDFSGKILAEKELGVSAEMAMDIEPIASGYIILSNVFVSEDRYDIKLLFTDSEGEVQDSVVFAGLNDQYGYTVTAVSDGGFFVTGNTRDIETDKNAILPITPGKEDIQDPLIIRFDNTFTAIDTFRIGGSYEGLGVKVFETGSAFTFAGYSDELMSIAGSDYNNNFVFRTFVSDPRAVPTLYAGDNSAEEEMSSFVKMPTGSFYGIGTETSATGLKEVFITSMVNSQGVPKKIFSGNVGNGTLEGVSGFPSSNGTSIFILATQYDVADTKNIRLIKVNAFIGSEVWSQQFGSTGYDENGNALAELPNGDIVIIGTVNLINQKKVTLIKINSNGNF